MIKTLFGRLFLLGIGILLNAGLVSAQWQSGSGKLTTSDPVGLGGSPNAFTRLDLFVPSNAMGRGLHIRPLFGKDFFKSNVPFLVTGLNSTLFKVTGDGKVGVGKAEPMYTLDVNGTINAQNILINGVPIGQGEPVNKLEVNPAIQLDERSKGTVGEGFVENEYWDVSESTGGLYTTYEPLGIGTDSPDAKLHVSGAAALDGAHIGNAFVGVWGGGTTYAVFTHDNQRTSSSKYALMQSSQGQTFLNATAAKSIHFRINNADQMVLKKSGDFGIGTSSPLHRLHVAKNVEDFVCKIENTKTSVGPEGHGGLMVELQTAGQGAVLQSWRIAGLNRMELDANGNLTASGRFKCSKVVVTQSPWADFVFEPGYELMPLVEVEKSIAENGHLPGMPSQKEVEEHGVDVGEVQAKLLQKIEELTLYVIYLEKKIVGIESRN